MARFVHHDLRLLNPSFSSPLLDVLTELEHLRRLELRGTTPVPVFMQLKAVFHLLESLASARIEGNHTTLADYVERKVTGAGNGDDEAHEIGNIEEAMREVEQAIAPDAVISEHFIRQLHSMTVEGLLREGDRTPGAWRTGGVKIAQADHHPPEAINVPVYMQELVDFINRDDPPKYGLMKVALAHHRFTWVHPFSNGNGRVVRLLTYALLIKYGFRVQTGGRVLNPAAVFCTDRERYYTMLARADEGSDEGLEDWCTYVLSGVLEELRKVDNLADYAYLTREILLPALNLARERQWITAQEEAVLALTARKGVVKAADLSEAMPRLNAAQRTYQIRKMVQGGMLQPVQPGARQYVLGFMNNYLLRGVIQALTASGFVPASVSAPPVPAKNV
jgi:Fic family protein